MTKTIVNLETDEVVTVALDADDLVQRDADAAAEAARLASPAVVNAPIYAQLAEIDAKSIRALREGNTSRLADLETQAAALRAQLVK